MNKWMKLLLFILLLCCTTASDYSTQHTLQCANVNDSWTYTQNLQYLWNIAILHQADKYIFIVLCPLIIIVQVIFLLTFIKYKLLKNTPQDIMFALIITQIILNGCLMSDAIYNFIYSNNQPMPSSFPKTCATFGSITSISSMAQKLYLIYFLVHVILSVKKSLKQNQFFKGKIKHLIPFLLAIIINLFSWMIGWLGLSLFGICEMTQTRQGEQQVYFPILQIFFSVAFIIFSIVTYQYFRKHMPESSALNKRKYQENLFITKFTIGISLMQLLSAVGVVTLYLNCRSSNPNPLMLIFATIFNLTRLAEFIYLICVLMMYRKIGKKVKKYIRKCFVKNVKDDISQYDSKRYTHKDLFELFDIGLKQKILDVLEDQNRIDFLKVTQIMTLLTGVRTAYREYLVPEESLKNIKNLSYHQQICFRIDSKWIKDYQQQALILPKLSLLDSKCTIYSPQIFKKLLAQDNIQNVAQSFDLIKNSSQLYKMCQTNNNGGGRSGQFFFFSCDNRYILKTVNKQEFTTLLEQLPFFYQHFINYPNTLICKVYGMFKICHKEISQKYYILLMKNISGCQQQQIKRTYDMKGSTDDRRVLKNYQDQSQIPQISGTVYKDLDFLSLEKRLYVKDQLAHLIRKQLKIDTLFLKHLNIIDYSLLIMVVDWENKQPNQSFWGQLQRIQSSNKKNIYYHMALIDISQKWDLRKKGEKWWKNIIGKIDTSTQQPSVYQQRFMNFMREITSIGIVYLRSKTDLEYQVYDNRKMEQKIQELDTPYKYLDLSIQMEAMRSQTQKMHIVIQIDKTEKYFSTPK